MTTRLLLALALLSPCAAFASATLITRSGEKESTILLDGNRMRIADPADVNRVVIYDGDAQKMTGIDKAKKTYMEITPEKIKKLFEQMQSSVSKMSPEQRARMDAAMAKMDPETRARMDAMMSGKPRAKADAPAAAPKPRFEKTGETETVAGYRCEGFRQMLGDKLKAKGCIIPWSAGAISRQDIGAMEKLVEFLREMGLPELPVAYFSEMPGYPGRWASIGRDGKEERPTSLVSVKRGSLPADAFKVPAGYTETDFTSQARH